jgi:hypothetical protein
VEPLSNEELDDLLRHYEAPPTPRSLEARFFPPTEPLSWWRWLRSGSIRVPAPAVVAVVILLAASIAFSVAQHKRAPQVPPRPSVTLADFQLVKQLQPRIVRRENARN